MLPGLSGVCKLFIKQLLDSAHLAKDHSMAVSTLTQSLNGCHDSVGLECWSCLLTPSFMLQAIHDGIAVT